MAVLVSVLYVTKLELYAGLPQELPSSLPSFDLEVSFGINEWTQRFHLLLKDILCENSDAEERKSGDQEMINLDQKVKVT